MVKKASTGVHVSVWNSCFFGEPGTFRDSGRDEYKRGKWEQVWADLGSVGCRNNRFRARHRIGRIGPDQGFAAELGGGGDAGSRLVQRD